MPGHRFRGGGNDLSIIGIAGVGTALLLIILLGIASLTSPPETEVPLPETTQQTQIEAARKEGYDLGYTNGYNAAQTEASQTYQQGYDAGRREVRWQAGVTGFVLGLVVSAGGWAIARRNLLRAKIRDWRKKHVLKKAFNTIPNDLPADVYTTAEQIAHAYANVTEQIRSAKGYLTADYIEQWHPKLKQLMGKSVQLMELIQELDQARTTVNEEKLDHTIKQLRSTIRRAKTDDSRLAAMKSLKRAKQTHADLQKTNANLDKCKSSLADVTGVLESMHLKMSNLKVNTQKTDLLEELSSDLELEMSALEEALYDVKS